MSATTAAATTAAPTTTAATIDGGGSSSPSTAVVVSAVFIALAVTVLIVMVVIYLKVRRTRGRMNFEQPRMDAADQQNTLSRKGKKQRGHYEFLALNTVASPASSSQPAKQSAERIELKTFLGRIGNADIYHGVFQHEGQLQPGLIKRFDASTTKSHVLDELQLLHRVDTHPYILRVICGTHTTKPFFVMYEPIDGGNLRDHLRQMRDSVYQISIVPVSQLVAMSMQVCDGMNFLQSKRIVHGHLAARCILISQPGDVCRISEVEEYSLTATNDEPTSIPPSRLPWCAPETIQTSAFTSLSDVWSFGVTVWEIFSLGATPHLGVPAEKLSQTTDSAPRLPPTACMPSHVVTMLNNCWNHTPSQRPSFGSMLSTLTALDVQPTVKVYQNFPPIDTTHEEPGLASSTPRKRTNTLWDQSLTQPPRQISPARSSLPSTSGLPTGMNSGVQSGQPSKNSSRHQSPSHSNNNDQNAHDNNDSLNFAININSTFASNANSNFASSVASKRSSMTAGSETDESGSVVEMRFMSKHPQDVIPQVLQRLSQLQLLDSRLEESTVDDPASHTVTDNTNPFHVTDTDRTAQAQFAVHDGTSAMPPKPIVSEYFPDEKLGFDEEDY